MEIRWQGNGGGDTEHAEAAKEKPEFDLIEKGKLGLEYTIVIVTLRKMQSSKNEEENYISEPETKDEENKMCLAWGTGVAIRPSIITWLGLSC